MADLDGPLCCPWGWLELILLATTCYGAQGARSSPDGVTKRRKTRSESCGFSFLATVFSDLFYPTQHIPINPSHRGRPRHDVDLDQIPPEFMESAFYVQ